MPHPAAGVLLRVNNSGSGLIMTTIILSISLPPELRFRLDAEAKRLHRSRSHVVNEAIQQYIARQDRDAFTQARDLTLREGLALSLAERLRLSEDLWKDFTRGRKPAQPWTVAFDTFDQYEEWRRRGGEQAG